MSEKKVSNIVFLVTSVVYYHSAPLSYSNSRSIFNPDERAAQTLVTIQSIRENVPQAKIFLIELGLKENLPLDLKNKVDQYIYLGNKMIIRRAVDGSKKGFGEAMGLICSARYVKGKGDYFFKISGRYFLNEEFKLDNFLNAPFSFLKRDQSISTRLYGFNGKVFNKWYMALLLSLPILLFTPMSIEYVLPKFIAKRNIKNLGKLGVSGFIAPAGEYINE